MTAAVFPDLQAVAGTGLETIVGALLTLTLITAVAGLIVCAIGWAIGHASGSWQLETRSRTGVLVALGAAALAGGAVAWLNFLIGIGATL